MNIYAALKGSFRDLVEVAGGNVRAAKVSRADGARISRYGSVQEAMHAPIDVVADLEMDVGDPIVTRQLAEIAGYVLVPKAQAEALGLNFHGHFADVARSTSDVETGIAEALRDGEVTSEEARHLLPKVGKAQTELAEFAADLKARAGASITPFRRGA